MSNFIMIELIITANNLIDKLGLDKQHQQMSNFIMIELIITANYLIDK